MTSEVLENRNRPCPEKKVKLHIDRRSLTFFSESYFILHSITVKYESERKERRDFQCGQVFFKILFSVFLCHF